MGDKESGLPARESQIAFWLIIGGALAASAIGLLALSLRGDAALRPAPPATPVRRAGSVATTKEETADLRREVEATATPQPANFDIIAVPELASPSAEWSKAASGRSGKLR